MTEIIKEIGIFIVIAQALVYFVPGEAYAKYVKVVIGIIMIARLTAPMLSLFTGNAMDAIFEEALELSFSFAEQTESGLYDTAEENGQGLLLSAVEEEIEKRLKDNPADGYEVLDVLVLKNDFGEVSGISVAVSKAGEEKGKIQIEKVAIGKEKEGETLTGEEGERLKNYYGALLEIPPEQIEIELK